VPSSIGQIGAASRPKHSNGAQVQGPMSSEPMDNRGADAGPWPGAHLRHIIGLWVSVCLMLELCAIIEILKPACQESGLGYLPGSIGLFYGSIMTTVLTLVGVVDYGSPFSFEF
jgi:hypothetical protein